MKIMIGSLVASLFLVLSSVANVLPNPTATTNASGHEILEEETYTSNSSIWGPSGLRPPPPPVFHSPWFPHESFYNHFEPHVADIFKKRVQEILAEWRDHTLTPLYHCHYSCEQYTPKKLLAQENPTQTTASKNPTQPQHVKQNPTHSQTIPTPEDHGGDKCPTVEAVIEKCAKMHQHEIVKDAYSWTCTFSDECCKQTLNVKEECTYLNPTIRWMKNICCSDVATRAGGEPNA
ncbi:unnamed protein product [Cuscuta epithymum]|uniref:Uncharacterized protein n=1 Tax=Cuscuta epithymum TaxID=186058 RepID=A0AAV0DC51_9ASTE|nr:unnamed protein product [Cuscuta epithymum]